MLFAIVGSSTVLPSALVPRPPSNVFHFFIFLFSSSCSSSCFALSHILNVYCNRFCCFCFCCRFSLSTAFGNTGKGMGEGGTVVSGRSWLARFYGHTTLQNWSNLLRSAPAWALHSKAVINNLITDFVSVRHKQH